MDSEVERKCRRATRRTRRRMAAASFVQDAKAPANLLAFAMNGRPLTAEHGFPLRPIMSGWYGIAHVKWLSRIEVIDRRYEGRHVARNY